MERTSQSVKCINTLVHTKEARVAEFEMAPNTEGEVHYHSTVNERCVCLGGRLKININSPPAFSLKPGESIDIPAGVAHQIINTNSSACQYMVVQFGGVYDFVAM